MNKTELLQWLKAEHEDWDYVIEQFLPLTWEKQGVAGHWSMKNVLAHLIGWNRKLVADIQAVLRNEEKPGPPWPADLETDDEINAWIYEKTSDQSVAELLSDERQVFNQLISIVESFHDDIEIETIHYDHDFYLVHLNGQRLHVGEFFDHYHDHHEAKTRSFLDKQTLLNDDPQ